MATKRKDTNKVMEELRYMLDAYDQAEGDDEAFRKRINFIYATGAMSEEVFTIIDNILSGQSSRNAKQQMNSSNGRC